MTDPQDLQPAPQPVYVPYPPVGQPPRSPWWPLAIVIPVIVLVVAGVAALIVSATSSMTRHARDAAPSMSAPLRTTPVRTVTVPSVNQVHFNSILRHTFAPANSCALPAWSTEIVAMQAFTDAANGCFGLVWGKTLARVVLFDSPDDHVPASIGCPSNQPVLGFWTCARTTASNHRSMASILGGQTGPAVEWIARSAATRVAVDSGQRADVTALVAGVGGPTSALGIEYLRRQEAQRSCLTGGFVGMLVDHGITRAEADAAATSAAMWTGLADNPDVPIDGAKLTTWFQRGAAVRMTAPCGDAWRAPVDELP